MAWGKETAMVAWSLLRKFSGLVAMGAWAGAVAIAGCSSTETATASLDGDSSTVKTDTVSDTSTGGKDGADAKVDTAASDVPQEPTKPDEEFWVNYAHIPRIPGSPDPDDQILSGNFNLAASGAVGKFKAGVSPLDAALPALELTKVAFAAAGSYNCAFGCFISDDLQYMAVATGQPDDKGLYSYALGTVAPDLSVKIGKFGTLKDVKHLAFAGKYLFYSQRAKCLGTGKCQYDIHRQGPFGGEDFTDVTLTRMAPDADEDVINGDTTYEGYFRVSADASTVVFLTPTIRSQTLYVWHAGNLAKVDYICPNFDGVKCVGSSSEYHDSDPAAVSMDGKLVVTFAIWDRWLRVRKYEVGSEAPGVFANLVESGAGAGAYLQAYCPFLQPGQHGEVKYEPWFSADSSTVYFVGQSKCGGTGNKLWTDVMSLPVAKIGPDLKPSDWINYTNNPHDNSAKNHVIEWLAMSPQRKYFVLSASAAVTEQGQPIPDGTARTMSDTEVYTMPVGGHVMTPLTNENAWHARVPQAVPPMAKPRS
ncbi:MAG: hypothetical protein HY902_20075 [Deltaproteobacteria bacterium]|nr:hypothetical protein [Deltaproteobacteria bacterium]